MRTFAVVGLILVAGLFGLGGLSDLTSANGNVFRESFGVMSLGIGLVALFSAMGFWGRRKDGQ